MKDDQDDSPCTCPDCADPDVAEFRAQTTELARMVTTILGAKARELWPAQALVALHIAEKQLRRAITRHNEDAADVFAIAKAQSASFDQYLEAAERAAHGGPLQ